MNYRYRSVSMYVLLQAVTAEVYGFAEGAGAGACWVDVLFVLSVV